VGFTYDYILSLFSGRLNRRDGKQVQNSKGVHRPHSHSLCREYDPYYLLWLQLTRWTGKYSRTGYFHTNGYEGQNGAYYWHLFGQFDRTEHPHPLPRHVLRPDGFVSASRYFCHTTPRGNWLDVRTSHLREPVAVC